LGLLRRREPVEVLLRCAYSVLIFFEGDHSSGSIFSSSSSLPRRQDGVCGSFDDSVCSSLDMLATFDGDKSKRVGGCTRMAFMIAWTGLSCSIGNSARVDVARLGFIWASVMKLGLKGTTPVSLKAAQTVDLVNASTYAGAHTVMNLAFETSCMYFNSNAMITVCHQTFIFAKHTTSSP
jgi:hypothetical protein